MKIGESWRLVVYPDAVRLALRTHWNCNGPQRTIIRSDEDPPLFINESAGNALKFKIVLQPGNGSSSLTD